MAELLFSLLTMAFFAFCAINFVFSGLKNKTVENSNQNNYLICYEDKTESDHGGKFDKSVQGCKFEISPEMESAEFFEIRLIGGGAGSTNLQNGGSGEERVVIYPSLSFPLKNSSSDSGCESSYCASCNSNGVCSTCVPGYRLDNGNCVINFYYRAVLGEGGQVGENGGQTSLLVVEKSSGNILKILETASGGIISNSTEANTSSIMNSTTSDFGSGNGGLSPNGHGHFGEVRIQW